LALLLLVKTEKERKCWYSHPFCHLPFNNSGAGKAGQASQCPAKMSSMQSWHGVGNEQDLKLSSIEGR